jgi:3D (Asp-Asp-Asp) domain-containing protein
VSTAHAEEAYGRFQLTFYWVADEKDAPGRGNALIYDSSCAVLGVTTLAFLRSLALEGTGALVDGRTLNFDARCACGWVGVPCFREVDERWGFGVDGRRLRPFRSVASDPGVVPTGTVLYIPDLDGVEVPGEPPWGGFVHDGCVVADDRGSAIGGAQLDFFVGQKDLYKILDKRLHRPVVWVYGGDGRCPARP